MFNKRLQHDFEIPNAGLHRVYLLEESDTVVTWPVICGQGEPVRLSFGNRNNTIYTPILPGTLTWRIVIQNQAARDAIDAVFESIEGDYRVEFYQVEGGITENLIWRGDLLLDQYNEDLRGFPGFVELVANDLASLQGKNYLHTDGFVHTGRETQLQIIKNCVQLLGYDLGFACSDAIFEDTMDGDPLVDDPMLQAYADNAWYYPVDQFLQTRLMSAWDVLSSILISKACRIRQWGGRWYVEQLGEAVDPVLPLEPCGDYDKTFASYANLLSVSEIDGLFMAPSTGSRAGNIIEVAGASGGKALKVGYSAVGMADDQRSICIVECVNSNNMMIEAEVILRDNTAGTKPGIWLKSDGASSQGYLCYLRNQDVVQPLAWKIEIVKVGGTPFFELLAGYGFVSFHLSLGVPYKMAAAYDNGNINFIFDPGGPNESALSVFDTTYNDNIYHGVGLTGKNADECIVGTLNGYNLIQDTPPADVLNLTGFPQETTIHLDWDANVFGVSVTHYDVFNGAEKLNDAPLIVTEYTATGLTVDTEYTLTVKAVNASGSSDGASVTRRTRNLLQPNKKSLLFAAADSQYTVLPHIPRNQFRPDFFGNCTFQTWVKTADNGIISVFGSYNSAGSASGAFLVLLNRSSTGANNKGHLTFLVNNGDGNNRVAYRNTNTGITDGTWHHLACVIDNGILRIYIDGVNITQGVTGSGSVQYVKMDQDFFIGAVKHPDGQAIQHFNGRLADFRIYNTGRTAAAVAADRSTLLDGDEANLVRYYPLTEGSGATTRDVTKTGNHITIEPGTGTLAGMWDNDIPTFT